MSERERNSEFVLLCVCACSCSCVHSTWVGVHMHSCRPYTEGTVLLLLVISVMLGKRRAKDWRIGL